MFSRCVSGKKKAFYWHDGTFWNLIFLARKNLVLIWIFSSSVSSGNIVYFWQNIRTFSTGYYWHVVQTFSRWFVATAKPGNFDELLEHFSAPFDLFPTPKHCHNIKSSRKTLKSFNIAWKYIRRTWSALPSHVGRSMWRTNGNDFPHVHLMWFNKCIEGTDRQTTNRDGRGHFQLLPPTGVIMPVCTSSHIISFFLTLTPRSPFITFRKPLTCGSSFN